MHRQSCNPPCDLNDTCTERGHVRCLDVLGVISSLKSMCNSLTLCDSSGRPGLKTPKNEKGNEHMPCLEGSAFLCSCPASLELTTLIHSYKWPWNFQLAAYHLPKSHTPKDSTLALLLLSRETPKEDPLTEFVVWFLSHPFLSLPSVFLALFSVSCIQSNTCTLNTPGPLDTYYSVLNITGTHSLAFIPGSAPPHRLLGFMSSLLSQCTHLTVLCVQSRATVKAVPWRHSMPAADV